MAVKPMTTSTPSTPMVRARMPQASPKVTNLTLPKRSPLKTPTAGSNAQTLAQDKAMARAQKATKVFGKPGR